MKIILLNVEGQTIKRSNKEQIVSNQVNDLVVQFTFSEDWDEFETIVAVFNGSDAFKAVIVENGQCFIPWETTLKESTNLLVSVVGVTEDLQFKKSPTPYLNLGTILKGGDPNADESAEPTPSLVEQILLKFKEIEDSEAERVAAEIIRQSNETQRQKNEAAREVWEVWDNQTSYKVGNKVEFDGSSYIYYTDAPAGTLPTDPVYTTLIAAKGDMGDTPVKGVDYGTQEEIAEISQAAADLVAGTAADLVVGTADNLSPVREPLVEDILLERTSAQGEKNIELGSAELLELQGMSVVQTLHNGNLINAAAWSYEGGEMVVYNSTGYLMIDPPPAQSVVESDADYLIKIGGIAVADDYDTGLQTCEASAPGVVEISERYSGDGWDFEGIGVGRVTITIYEDDYEYESFTIEVYEEVLAERVEPKIKHYMDFTAGHKYYVEGEVKCPAPAPGIVLFSKLESSSDAQTIDLESTDDWQVVRGIINPTAGGDGDVGFWDRRKIETTITKSWFITSVSVNAKVFSNKIRAFSPAWDGSYRFVYNNTNWRVNGEGSVLNMTEYGIEVAFSTQNEAVRNNSEFTVHFSFPFKRTPYASLDTFKFNGIQNIGIDPVRFAGAIGYNAAEGSYVFTYVPYTGWTLPGSPNEVKLVDYGFTGSELSMPDTGATITVNLTFDEEDIRVRRLAVYDLTQTGMEDISIPELAKIVGGLYHPKGLTNAVVGALQSSGTAENEVDENLQFSQDYELCRLPNGICDTLDLESGKFFRRVGVMTVSGSSGEVVALAGAKSGTVYLSASGNIGSVSGTYLTLSKLLSGVKVYYELASPELTNITEPGYYRVATGGTECVKRYDSTAGTYIKSPLGLRSKIKYRPDYPRQIENDRKKILALLSALGLASSSDPSVIEDASKIAAALSTFVQKETT